MSGLRDRPSGRELLELGRQLLLDELLPLLPPQRRRDLHLVATAMAIAAREAAAGDKPTEDILRELAALYPEDSRPYQTVDNGRTEAASRDSIGQHGMVLLRRFAADLRNGEFESSEPRQSAARVILWRMTAVRLRQGNPQFLAANGFV
jgi:hypothetical protein